MDSKNLGIKKNEVQSESYKSSSNKRNKIPQSFEEIDSEFMKTQESDKISFEKSEFQNISKIKKPSKENSEEMFIRYCF